MSKADKSLSGQSAKFLEAARSVGTSDNDKEFNRALKKILKASPATARKRELGVHDSDCATNNGPALPAGPCDCSLSKSRPE